MRQTLETSCPVHAAALTSKSLLTISPTSSESRYNICMHKKSILNTKKKDSQVLRKKKKGDSKMKKTRCYKSSVHTVRKKRHPDTNFRFPDLNFAIPLMSLSTTSLHQLYPLISSVIEMEWKALTHNFGLDVVHKKVLIANISQTFNHLSSIEFFPSPDNHFSTSTNDGAL